MIFGLREPSRLVQNEQPYPEFWLYFNDTKNRLQVEMENI